MYYQRRHRPFAERVDYMEQQMRRCMCIVASTAIHCAAVAQADEPPVTALAFAPAGDIVVAGSQSGIALLSWPDLELNGTVVTELQHVNELVFSPNGTRLAASGGSPGQVGTVEVYVWPQLELLWRAREHDDVVFGSAWHPDGSRLATASLDRLCKILDGESGDVVTTIEGHSRGVTSVVLFDDIVVTAAIDQSIRVWDLPTGAPVLARNNHLQPVLDLALRPSADGTSLPMVASTGDDQTVRFWQPTIGRMVRFARLPSAVLGVEWSSDGASIFAACRDGYLREIDPIRVDVIREYKLFESWAYSLAVHPNEREVVVGGRQDEPIRILPAE